ncbi:MAG: hypothetical protein KF819_22555 [Labilithrix sp.]|nr:hypothetical protein [Labilithrix sp.]
MRARPWIAGCTFLLACSSATEVPPGAPPADPPPAAAEPVACDEGTYRTSANVCEKFPSLSVARSPTAIGPVRDHHTTVILEEGGAPYLYVFGGTDDWRVLHDDVQRAKIRDDGGLDAFEPAGRLGAPRAGHCVARIKDRLLLAGGIVPAGGRMGPSTSSILVRIGEDGAIADVAPGPDLPKAVMHLTCEVHGDFVYALGGRGANSKSTTMSARARIGADGSLGAFEAQTPLAPDRSHHASFIREKRLYVLGGLTGDPAGDMVDRSDAIVADIGDDGALGAWAPAGKLPTSVSVSSAQLYKDAVYVVGGLEDAAGFTDKIRRATFEADGTLSDFATVEGKLPGARGHVHQTPMYETFIYSVGGKDNANKSLGTIDVGKFE